MNDLFSTQQLDFDFNPPEQGKTISQVPMVQSVLKVESLSKKINFEKLLDIINDLAVKHKHSHPDVLKRYQSEYYKKIKTWDDRTMDVVNEYGIQAVADSVDGLEMFFGGVDCYNKKIKAPITYGIARISVLLNRQLKIKFFNAISSHVDLDYAKNEKGEYLPYSIVDMLIKQNFYNETMDFIINNISFISKIKQVETWYHIFKVIRDKSYCEAKSFSNHYSVIDDCNYYSSILIIMMGLICSPDEIFDNFQSQKVFNAFKDVFSKYDIGSGNNSVLQVLSYFYEKGFNFTQENFEKRMQKMLDIDAILPSHAFILASYLPCSKEYKQYLSQQMKKTQPSVFNMKAAIKSENKNRNIDIICEIVDSKDANALKVFLANFKIRYSASAIIRLSRHLWKTKPYFKKAPLPDALNNNAFLKSFNDFYGEALSIIVPYLNKKQQLALTTQIFYSIWISKDLDTTEKNDYIQKGMKCFSNAMIKEIFNSVKNKLDEDKVLTSQTNVLLKRLEEYIEISQIEPEDKEVFPSERRGVL